MKKQDIYKLLEDKMLRYADLVSVPVCPNRELLVKLTSVKSLKTRQIDERMLTVTGNDIYVRKTVAGMLKQVAGKLNQLDNNYSLEIVYGYRTLQIQQELFGIYKGKLAKLYSGEALLEAIHRLVAVPEVSGHPTGGAVDVQILALNKPLDFGNSIWKFEKDSYTFSPFISRRAWQNRQVLRGVMMNEGFAPFDGEWWHFSYGDREWAAFYCEDCAVYDQLPLSKDNCVV